MKFIQEVISSTKAVEHYYPQTDVVIELGGEDAKITYLSGGIDQRMNGNMLQVVREHLLIKWHRYYKQMQ